MAFERLLLFLAPIAVLLVAEAIWPRRERRLRRVDRWPGSIALLAIGTGLSRLAAPAGLIGVAIWAERNGVGVLNLTTVPTLLAIVVVVIAMDFGVWLQHVVFHKVPLFWRFHRVHHADVDFDVMTALRFHPGEILISLIWKACLVLAIGASPLAVLIFEVVLNVCAMFSHSNLDLPIKLDRRLRLALVTPDMHRVHHSTDLKESQRNYGFCLPWWDRLFGLYQDQPKANHLEMDIGQLQWRRARDHALWPLLTQPIEAEPLSPGIPRDDRI
ncbi:MAG: sterol desaturase family protein [Pseudomonadota bacterium]